MRKYSKKAINLANISYEGQSLGGDYVWFAFFFPLAAISRWTVLENFPEQMHFGLTFGQRGRVP